MAVYQAWSAEPARQAVLEMLDALLGANAGTAIAVRMWDGTVWRSTKAPSPDATLVLKHPGAFVQMLSSPSDLVLGEMYIFDDLDVEGDLQAVFPVIDRLRQVRLTVSERLRYAGLLRRLPKPVRKRRGDYGPRLHGATHSPGRDSVAVRRHYDLSNDFYSLWLDRRMVYSCAYFRDAADTLDVAQEQKLDYLCRKLRLRRGERLLDLGCGWGGLILHAAQRYGARALGITLSPPQAELANERIRAAGVAERCRAEVRDYRGIEESESFDKLVSVGMFEHVGEKLLPEYFRRAWRLLKPGGVFLNHGIACAVDKPDHGPSFIDKYVFPDGELVPVSTTLRIAEQAGWEVRDLESLREHYAMTLRRWVERLEQQAAQARALVGEVNYRIWRLYMAACAHAFRRGWVNVYQALLVKRDNGKSGLPLTRADWYA